MIGYALVAGFAIAFLATFLITPKVIKHARERNFAGRDVHKYKRVFVAELGGISIVLGFIFGVSAFIASFTFLGMQAEFVSTLAAAMVVLIVFIIGMIDDLFWIKRRSKIIMPLFAAVPLMAIKAGNTAMSLPYFGTVDFGWLYILLLIPFAITGVANAMNMIGGNNGSEAGLGALIIGTLLIIALDANAIPAAALLVSMLGALLAFLYFNWSPARIFMGDSGTLQIGAVIASAVIIGNMQKFGVLLLFWYFVNLVQFAWGLIIKAKLVKFSKPLKSGRLVPPKTFWRHYLPFTIEHFTKPTEVQLVLIMLAMQALVCIGTLAFYFGGF